MGNFLPTAEKSARPGGVELWTEGPPDPNASLTHVSPRPVGPGSRATTAGGVGGPRLGLTQVQPKRTFFHVCPRTCSALGPVLSACGALPCDTSALCHEYRRFTGKRGAVTPLGRPGAGKQQSGLGRNRISRL